MMRTVSSMTDSIKGRGCGGFFGGFLFLKDLRLVYHIDINFVFTYHIDIVLHHHFATA